MAELKPCPFCGEMPNRGQNTTTKKYWIGCENPRCRINPTADHHISKAVVTREWNKRAENEELEFTRKFIHEHGLEFALASAWNRRFTDEKGMESKEGRRCRN